MRSASRHLRRTATWAGLATVLTTGLVAPAPSGAVRVAMRTVRLASVARPGWTTTLPHDANMIGFSWRGDAHGTIEIRVDGGGWISLDANPEEGPDRGSREDHGVAATAPLWLGRSPSNVEMRVAQGVLSGLEVHALRAPAANDGTWQAASAAADPAPIGWLSRKAWGADESARTCAPEYALRVRFAIVHHTATANDYGADDVPAILRSMAAYHTKVNGWCDLGYNFVVDRFGRVWEGRAGGVDRPVIGAHASGFNVGTTGVAILGDFEHAPVPAPVNDALHRLLTWKLALSGVDAGAVIRAGAGNTLIPTIVGHRDVNSTACPGRAEELLPALRVDVQRAVLASVPYPAAGWTPATGAPPLLALDAHGGLHPAGGQPAVAHSWHAGTATTARAAVREGSGGYVVEGDGSLHPFGNALPTTPSGLWVGADVARGIAAGPNPGSGWVLSGDGDLHAFGAAPVVLNGPSWPGQDLARAVAGAPGGLGGYVLDGRGGIHAFGVAAPVVATAYWPDGDVARAIALRPDGQSGYVLDRSGALHAFGGAPPLRASSYWPGQDVARGLVLTAAGDGGWVLDSNGDISPFGAAPAVATSMTWTGTGLSRGLV